MGESSIDEELINQHREQSTHITPRIDAVDECGLNLNELSSWWHSLRHFV